MRMITDVVKLLGKERHDSIDDLTKAVFDKCKKFGITETKGKKPISIDIVNRIIRNVLSCIKLGKGHWSTWSYRLGNNFLKLYDDPAIDIITVDKETLEGFEYIDTPEIRVRVDPVKEGVDIAPFYKNFKSLSEASVFLKREEYATGIFLSIGYMLIPLEETNKKI